jgi:hypothetical protein
MLAPVKEAFTHQSRFSIFAQLILLCPFWDISPRLERSCLSAVDRVLVIIWAGRIGGELTGRRKQTSVGTLILR